MSGAKALARKSKASALVGAYLAMLDERECSCGYFESARRHCDASDPDYHLIDEVPKAPRRQNIVIY